MCRYQGWLYLLTGLPNKACTRLRDLATAPARGITQPRTNLIREPCTKYPFVPENADLLNIWPKAKLEQHIGAVTL